MKISGRVLKTALFIVLLSGVYTPLLSRTGAAKPEKEAAKPEKVHRITRVQKPTEWYSQQADLWKGEIDRNPQNAEAWYNYYWASRYALSLAEDKQTRLDRIIADMGEAIPETYEYLYSKYCNISDLQAKDISLLERAHQLQPDRPEHYEDFGLAYELTGEKGKAKACWEKLYESKYIASGWVNYNYNVLMSTERNAILFTNGDNDTYPAWMLQRAKGVREDVTVLNVFLSKKRPYLKRILQERGLKVDWEALPESDSESWIPALCRALRSGNPGVPIYLAVTVNRRYIGNLMDDLYLVGLAYQYSTGRIDNIALLKKNLEKNLRLEYLKYDWYSETHISARTIAERINPNYIPLFMMLYEHFKTGEEREKADYWRNFALDLARKGNSRGMLDYIEERE